MWEPKPWGRWGVWDLVGGNYQQTVGRSWAGKDAEAQQKEKEEAEEAEAQQQIDEEEEAQRKIREEAEMQQKSEDKIKEEAEARKKMHQKLHQMQKNKITKTLATHKRHEDELLDQFKEEEEQLKERKRLEREQQTKQKVHPSQKSFRHFRKNVIISKMKFPVTILVRAILRSPSNSFTAQAVCDPF